jgi:hypothetical protein
VSGDGLCGFGSYGKEAVGIANCCLPGGLEAVRINYKSCSFFLAMAKKFLLVIRHITKVSCHV